MFKKTSKLIQKPFLTSSFSTSSTIPWFTNKLPSKVSMVELGPRDGLQNEKEIVSFDNKINLIKNLIDCGSKLIEVGAFVSPKWVPQMADSMEIFDYINNNLKSKYNDIIFRGLVLNEKGFENAISKKLNEILFVIAATEEFSQKNMNCDIKKTFNRLDNIISLNNQLSEPMSIKIAVSTLFGCPYKGKMNHEYSVNFIKKIYDNYVISREITNVNEILLCDTVGYATSYDIYRVCSELENKIENINEWNNFGVHFHDTYGQALTNVLTALGFGIKVIESSVAGLGGCPFAKGASGNVATEDIVYLLNEFGIDTGYDINKLVTTGNDICKVLKKDKKESRVGNALNSRMSTS